MNLSEMKKAQQELDAMINGVRERDLVDIKQSLIAECVEFNEELGKLSHKTWKSKMFNEKQLLTEGVDILFFMLQLSNKVGYEPKDVLHYPAYQGVDIREAILKIQFYVINENYDEMFSYWVTSMCALGFTIPQVEKEYFEKLEYNKTRIGKEWN